jgi:acyl-coenzyme A synthetase/AMP-(fatty) acid ligase
MFMVPSQVRSILALGRKAGRARVVVVAGDRLLPEEAEAFEADHGTLVGLYGSTETHAMTASGPDDPAAVRQGTAGHPVDGARLALDDAAAEGSEGDGVLPMRVIVANGFAGYADPETGVLIAPAPEIWTPGDLVRLHDGPDGIPRVEVLGRTDHAVKRDGLLVHLGQIESCLARAEGVAVTAVVPAGRSRRGVGLLAFCTLSRPGMLTDEAILAHCREALPARAVPDRVEILSEMPMLASGKVDRRHLAKMAERLVDAASPAS